MIYKDLQKGQKNIEKSTQIQCYPVRQTSSQCCSLEYMSGNNENIVEVEVIENLAMQIGEHLGKLEPNNYEGADAVWKAQEYLKNYQVNQIKALRDEFEE